MGDFGKCLTHRARGSRLLSVGGRSLILRALAGPETSVPISAGDTPIRKTMAHDGVKSLNSNVFKTEHLPHNYEILPVRSLAQGDLVIDRPLLPPSAAESAYHTNKSTL